MILGRCQICGRRKGSRKVGGLVEHYVRGDACSGTGHPPIEQDDRHLEREIARLAELARKHRAIERRLIAARVNWIDPIHRRIIDRSDRAATKLQRRLTRHRNWPARYRRQMERDGWAEAPPAYLLARESAL